MADNTPALQGALNSDSADDRALFRDIFTGEVLTAYDKSVIMESRHRVRHITEGKSASFANTGRATGRYHVPGSEILGQPMNHADTIITVDDLLISDVFISNLYEAMNHYEVRAPYASQLGKAVARTFDKSVMRSALTAARSANKIQSNGTGAHNDLPGGSTISITGYQGSTAADKAIAIAEALFDAHEIFLNNEVDMEGIFCAIRPSTYMNLVRNKDLLNVDWGGLGSYARAELPMVAGIPLVVTPHLPYQDDALNEVTEDGIVRVRDAGDVLSTKYSGDYSTVEALIMTPEAAGTVKLMELGLEDDYEVRRQGTLMVARQACGSGVLRPEVAVEVLGAV